MKGRIPFIASLIILLLIFLLSNMIVGATFKKWRFDLTEENVYSLSKGTRNILDKLQENVTLKYYFSKTDAIAVPFIKNYADRVRDLLNEYKLAGHGRVILELYDPRPDSEEQEWAEKFGIQTVPLRSGMPIYFGLAGINERGDDDVITFFNPNREEFLEYDITRLIYNLSKPKRKVIGLISALPILGSEPNPYAPPGPSNRRIDPWIFTRELQQVYSLNDLGTSINKITDDIDILLIIHPKDLPENTLFAIDQFVLRGGRALIFVDPYCEAETPSHDPQKPYEVMFAKRDSNLEKLFKTWGVGLVKGKVAADSNLAARVNIGLNKIVPYVAWLNITEGNINRKDIVSGRLENLLVAYPGFLRTQETDNVTFTPLLETTKAASPVNATYMELSNPASLLENYTPGGEKLSLALRVSGRFKTAFPDGKPSKDKKDNKGAEILKDSTGESNLIIVADVDMLSDRFSVRIEDFLGQKIAFPFNDNINLFYNAIENLSGSNDLIGIRSRGKFTRPFTKVKEIERAAEERWKGEERALVQRVSEINARLKELLKPGKEEKRQALSKAIEDEIIQYRLERKNAQKKLREVRRKLRQDKESLGNNLFFVNTFLIPLLICCFGITTYILKRR